MEPISLEVSSCLRAYPRCRQPRPGLGLSFRRVLDSLPARPTHAPLRHDGVVPHNRTREPERIIGYNTCQVAKYDNYELGSFSEEAKLAWREKHWEEDLQ